MTIAVDFDGTIVEHAYPKIGKEIPFAIDTLKELAEENHRIILWTAREGHLLDEAVQFCRERGLEFYAINADYPDAQWENYRQSRKPKVDMFIDDRNLGGLPDWVTIYEMITSDLTFGDLIERAAGGDLDEEEGGSFFENLRDSIIGGRHKKKHSRHHW